MNKDKKMDEEKKEKVNSLTPDEFLKAYTKLCEEMGYRIVVIPTWISRDDGSWSTILKTSVGILPKLDKEEAV